MYFELDSRKAAKNLRKHGVSFEKASSIFYHPLAVTSDHPDHADDENTFITFGVSSERPTPSLRAERGPAIGIISARRASRSEKDL